MSVVSSRAAVGHDQILQAEFAIKNEREFVAGVMTMLILDKAGNAEIVVGTVLASNEFRLIEFYNHH